MAMDADTVVFEAPAHFCFYKSGKIGRLNRPPILPAGVDETTGVTSKDVVLDADTGFSVRLYLPNLKEKPSAKLPVLVYFHGGSFLIGSAEDTTHHTYFNALAAATGVRGVSVDYGLAPEHPLPAACHDAWAVLRWATLPQDDWIILQSSTDTNIVRNMLMRAASNDGSPRVEGAYCCGNTPIKGEPPGADRQHA